MFTDIGIDLGTAKTVVISGKMIVLNEPSVVLMENYTEMPYKFGREAYDAIGRSSDRYMPVCPIERGVIANYNVAEHMVRYFMRKVTGGKMTKPRVVVSMPSGVTEVQQRSIVDAIQNAGGRSVCPIEAPVAAAIGIGIDFSKPHGTIIVDIGAGTTDVAVMSMGGLSKCESARVAGTDIDDAIIKYMKKEHNLLIGRHTAETIKKQIGCAMPRDIELAMYAKGLSSMNGLPTAVEINANEICEAISETTYQICAAVQSVLNKTPPELVGDIADDGIYLTGGTALLNGMDALLEEYTGIKVTRVENVMTCVAKGIGIALRNFDILQNGDYEFRTLQDLISYN
jgi:rod shape-determining protein MreB